MNYPDSMSSISNPDFLAPYKDFILYKTWADLRSEARRYYISYAWWILGPVLEMAVFFIVFGVLLQRGTENFVPFLLIGVITWKWFGTTVQHCAKSILNSRGLVQRVYLPKTVFPLIVTCTDTFKFIIAFSIIIVLVNAWGITASQAYFLLPVIMITQLLLILATGMICAAITPFFPDFELFLGYAIRMVFFLSGLFYDASQIPERYHSLFFMNPMARIINEYREVLMHAQAPDFQALGFISLYSVLVLILAWKIILRFDKIYPKVLAQ